MNKLFTEAGEKLNNDPAIIPWDVYPRPHMKRKEWLNLNGLWDFETGSGFKGSIRVPFCAESPLSGVGDIKLSYGEKLTYRRTFRVPEGWRGRNIILNLGAVSRECTVSVNGKRVGGGESAYFPMSFDITSCLKDGENEIEIVCSNDLDRKYPWGKQRIKRGGMWYTPCSGIWQTVWLEPVPEESIRELYSKQDGNEQIIYVTGVRPGWVGGAKDGFVYCEGKKYNLKNGVCRIGFKKPRLWSPEEPNLYDYTVKYGEDEVTGYFAFRTVEVKTVSGRPRICLNGKPYFFNGLLDQGYFSDGLWTPAEPEEYERDILKMKALGFNTTRKHIKIEPEIYYYYCDKLGMAVFQDMVNNGSYRYFRDTVLPTAGCTYLPRLGLTELDDRYFNTNKASRNVFLRSMEKTVRLLSGHPSIVYWTIFNEGWGQFNADEAYDALKKLDPTRVIDATSGWFHRRKTDVDSLHIYFKKQCLGKRRELPQVISEFGGYVCKLPEHSFNREKTYGYKKFDSRESFIDAVRRLYLDEVVPLVDEGLCAAIYTQVSDVEDETNGFITYDRRIIKANPEELADIKEKLLL